MNSWGRLLVAALFATCPIGCRKQRNEPAGVTIGASTTPSASTCPSEAFLEELHAAAFHFQHGPTPLAREHLEVARRKAPAPADAISTNILGQLTEISRRVESDTDWAQSATENVRLELGDWSCMPASLHQRFHTKLPPLP
jgi:hypothetical protein